MRRPLKALLATAVVPLVAAGMLLVAKPASAATLTQVTGFGNNPSNLRMFIYVPDVVAPQPALLVAIHYCTGTASALFNGSFHDFVTAADRSGFIIIFPEATRSGGCFDVYSPQALTRGGGSDPVGVMSMVSFARTRYNVDPNRIFVSGASSGAMMTNVMAAEYPDVFKAGSAFMGVPAICFATGSASNTWNSQCANGQIIKSAQEWGSAARAMNPGFSGSYPRMQLFHGTMDSTLNFNNFGEEIKQWTNLKGVGQTPSSTDSPQSGWTRTRYGGSTAQAPVEGISVSGVGHSLPTNGMVAFAINFLGLNGGPPPGSPPAPSSPPPSGGQQIVGRASNRCVDIVGQNTANGTPLQLFDCNSNWSQRWALTSDAFINPQSGKCLNAAGITNGSRVNLNACNGSSAQQWQVRANGNIANVQSGRCLDAIGQGTANGTQLQIYDCVAAGQGNQQWTLR